MNFIDINLHFLLMLGFYICGAIFSLIFIKNSKLGNILSNILYSIASSSGILISLFYLLSNKEYIQLAHIKSNIPFLSFKLGISNLSAYFILTLSILTLCVSIYSIGYMSQYYGKRNISSFNFLFGIFIVSLISVFSSGNMIIFLLAWEVMSLTSYFLVIFESGHTETQKSGTLYLIMTHIATAFLTVAFITTYSYTGSFDIVNNSALIPPFSKNMIFLCLLIGFGTKAGIIPLHIWLPYAHPAAPSNVSALMSGIMIKTSIFGLIQFVFVALGGGFEWWGITLLIVGSISAVLGVAYALMEIDIKRLLAYSSIENTGIILIGLGISIYGFTKGNSLLSSLALVAALIHLFNHSLFKGALFLGAGSVHYSTHTKNMEKLGGLLKKMPYTGLFFLIACLSISSMPFFNGFISEWFTLQALFHSIGISTQGVKLIAILAAAVLAMAGALAAACFVKAFGISFLGLPRSTEAHNSMEVPAPMLMGTGLLSFLCIIFGLFPNVILILLNKISLSIVKTSVIPDLKGISSFVYYPKGLDANKISPMFLFAAGVILAAVVFLVVKLINRGTKERTYGTWDCGFKELNPRMQYTATGFSKPLRIVFRAIYRPSRELQTEEGTSPYYPKTIKYVVLTQSVFEKYLYIPLTGLFTAFSGRVRRLVQTGSVHTYLLYIFITIVGLLIYYRFSNS
ncbi:MAG TPA: proton-conducting transporter membrane subunit [Pseudobacteroides sp.]|uniref:proton-conducting transporter transmembrane domain-containing protein n=1 Tax=Pseudobacteroides sp. TaxID=1968840 RepID=UPI002F95CF8E